MSATITLALAATFNLVCSVNEGTYAGSKESSTRDVTLTLRVDMDRKLWCEGRCAIVHRIHSHVDRTIIFAFAEDGTVPARLSVSATSDPWVYSSTSQTADHIVVGLGNCEQTSFSGFPASSGLGM